MSARGGAARRILGRRRPAEVQVKDDVVSALVRHPTWSITNSEEGLIFSRSEDSAGVVHDSDIGRDQLARLKKHIGKAFGGSQEQLLLRSRSPSGSDQDLQIRLNPVVEEGRIQRVMGSTKPLADTPGAPGISTERPDLARTVVESALDCIVVMDHKGSIVEFNPAAERMFGCTREEALKKQVADLMPPTIADIHNERLAQIVETGESARLDRRMETVMLRADGTIFPVEFTVTAIPERTPPLFVGFLRDLTACKRADEALLDSELRLQAIAENVSDVIYHFRISPEPEFEYVSPACATVLGYQVEEFYADPNLWRRIIHPDDLGAVLGTLRGEPSSVMLHVRCIRKGGQTIDCHLGSTTVRDRWGRVAASVGVLRDETERIQTQRRLQESKDRLHLANTERLRLLRRLVAAHEEERSSIAEAIHDDSIQAVSALAIQVSALRRRVEDHGLRSSLTEIEKSVSEAVSRLRRLMFDLHPTTLDRRGLAATVEAHLTQYAGEGSTTYSLDHALSREPPQRVRLALYRVIQEAITNARKHARAGSIVVLLSEDRDEFVARVHDDGVGFPVGEIESPAGHLGLSAMRERAEMAGGRISIESTPHKGTIVEVRIPAREDQPST